MLRRFYFSFLILTLFAIHNKVKAQQVAIGEWRIHAALQDAISVVDAGDRIYCATKRGLYAINKEDNSLMRFSKANGLSDVAISSIDYNPQYKVLVIAYQSSNIDLLYANGNVINIPDIKRKNIPGDKSIYHVNAKNRNVLLSCGFGIVVIDLNRKETKDTYIIGPTGKNSKVLQTCDNGKYTLALTEDNIATIAYSNPNPANYASWKYWPINTNGFGSAAVSTVFSWRKKLYALAGDSIFLIDPKTNTASLAYQSTQQWHLRLVKSTDNLLLLKEQRDTTSNFRLSALDSNFQALEVFANDLRYKDVVDAFSINSKDHWLANTTYGLMHLNNAAIDIITPNAPIYNDAFDIETVGNTMWFAPGSVDKDYAVYLYNASGYYTFQDEYWNSVNQYTTNTMDGVLDLIAVAPKDNNHAYFASFGKGLITASPDGVTKQTTEVGLLQMPGDPGSYRVSDLCLDNDNLWMVNYGVETPIVLLDKTGKYYRFSNPFGANQLGKMVKDQTGQFWITSVGPSTKGVLVYNPGSDIYSGTDDQFRLLQKGQGLGNLPDSRVTALAVDKDGAVWVGTGEGLGIFYDPSSALTNADAQQLIIPNATDSILAYVLGTEIIQDIKIDGANRKWIATTHGVWLLSSDGLTELEHFNVENSPLLSDNVYCIGIQGTSGEVFFGTEKGICSYRGTATEGTDKNENVKVFPNPVRADYTGMIAVRGLVENAHVRFTDVAGNLVYSTKALGGQAVWDGRDVNGNRVGSGVYLVFATNADGNESCVTRFLYYK
jgi:hypothetical protein